MPLPEVSEKLSQAMLERFQLEVEKGASIGDFLNKHMKEIEEENPYLVKKLTEMILHKPDIETLTTVGFACIYTYKALKSQLEVNELNEMMI